MTAIASTGRRLTPRKGQVLGPQKLNIAVTATKHAKAGGMAMLVSAGTCEPGAAGTGNVCLGVFQGDFDNSNSLSPAPVAEIATGNYPFFQTGTTITRAHIGTTVYMADDQTVTLTAAGNSPAGTVVDIDDDGTSVIVAISPLLPITSHGFAVQSQTKSIVAGVDTLAGQGSGADTNGTARVYNLGSALPAGAILMGYIVHLVTSFTGNTTLVAKVGGTGDDDSIMTTFDLMGTAGYGQGTPGDTYVGLMPTNEQLLLTLTPDNSSKVSAAATGEVHVTVFYADATGI